MPSFGRVGASGELRAIGNAILCSQPLEDFRAVALARPPFLSYRHPLVGAHQGVLASIGADGRRVTIGVVHLERRWDPEGRGRQMEDFLRAIGDAAPVIIGGDLNTTTMDMDRPWSLLETLAEIVSHPKRFREPQPYEPLFERLREHGLSIEGANVPAGADVHLQPDGATAMASETRLDRGAWNPAGERVGCSGARAHVDFRAAGFRSRFRAVRIPPLTTGWSA